MHYCLSRIIDLLFLSRYPKLELSNEEKRENMKSWIKVLLVVFSVSLGAFGLQTSVVNASTESPAASEVTPPPFNWDNVEGIEIKDSVTGEIEFLDTQDQIDNFKHQMEDVSDNQTSTLRHTHRWVTTHYVTYHMRYDSSGFCYIYMQPIMVCNSCGAITHGSLVYQTRHYHPA